MAFVQEPTRRRTGLYGLAVLVLAAVAVVVVAVGGGGGGKNKSSSPSRGGQESQSAGSTKATLSATNASFEEFFGIRLPKMAAGPREMPNGRALGFEHSPDGAVLAAIHILYRASASPGPAVFDPTIREQMVGPDKDKFLSKIQADYASAATSGTGPTGELAGASDQAKAIQSAMWAYRLDLFEPGAASVQLLLRSVPSGSAPVFVNMSLTVKWDNGDWRLVAPLNGDFASVARRVSEVPQDYVVLGQN